METDDGAFELPCAEYTTLFIKEAQIPGKKPMEVQDILRGTPGLFSPL
jgi:methionyl-tRNA formyltransferase